MKKLDRYILKKILTAFFFVVVLLVLIVCVLDFTEKNDDFIRNDLSAGEILRYYLSVVPFTVTLVTPITIFIASVFVTASMAAKSEIVAILASGVNFGRMMVPYFAGGVLIASMSFVLANYVIPEANKFRLAFEWENFGTTFSFDEQHSHIKIGTFEYLYIGQYDNRLDVGSDATLERIEGQELKEKITAKTIKWNAETRKWSLKNWQRRLVLPGREVITSGGSMEDIDTLLALSPSDFESKKRHEETLTLPELNDYIVLQRSRGADDVQVYLIEKYVRFMSPFTVIILCFIGLMVSAKKSRRGIGFQIALGFLIAFVFITFFILAKSIAAAGIINPLLAIWIPNIVFSLVGVILYYTLPK